jgi:hypothetical protein
MKDHERVEMEYELPSDEVVARRIQEYLNRPVDPKKLAEAKRIAEDLKDFFER